MLRPGHAVVVLLALAATTGCGVRDLVLGGPDAGGRDAGGDDAGVRVDAAAACEAPRDQCGGECVEVASDDHNCGACGRECGAVGRCVGGACVSTCRAALATCGAFPAAYCAELSRDPRNCGMCGRACDAGSVCEAGACKLACTAPLMECAGGCVDLETDAMFCGSCRTACRTLAPGAVAACAARTCAYACEPGLGDCDTSRANGCETDLTAWGGVCPGCADGGSSGGVHCMASERCVQLPRSPAFGDVGRHFTIEAWVRPTTVVSVQTIFARRSDGPGNYALFFAASGVPAFGAQVFDDGGEPVSATSPAVALGAWHHVALVVDGRDVRVFADGEAGAMASAPSDITWFAADPGTVAYPEYGVFIGYTANAGVPGVHRFAGDIDEVRLSASALYTAPFVLSRCEHFTTTATAVGVWLLDEASGDTVLDSGPTGTLTGTLVGATRTTATR